MSDEKQSISSAAGSILRDFSDPEMVRSCEERGWNESLWGSLASSGFTGIAIPESNGGSGGDVADVCAVIWQIGRHAASVPIAETSLLGGWALSAAGLPVPDGPSSSSVGHRSDIVSIRETADGWRADGQVHRVPWGAQAQRVALIADVGGQDHVVSVDPSRARVEPGRNLAGESRDTIVLDGVPVDVAPAPAGVDLQSLRLRGALARSVSAAGTLDRVRELTAEYTTTRHQFGRPLSAFQAVQRHIVRIAEQAVTAGIASETAALNSVPDPDPFDVASAKIVAGIASSTAAQAAHQAHGAMGMTKEYELGQLTRRLWAWRDEFGSDREWSIWLGRHVSDAGAAEVWPRITIARSDHTGAMAGI